MKVLTGEQCAQHEAEGYLCLTGFLSVEWLHRLGKAMDKFIERSQSLSVTSARGCGSLVQQALHVAARVAERAFRRAARVGQRLDRM
jgi:hypothetical protein